MRIRMEGGQGFSAKNDFGKRIELEKIREDYDE